MSSTAQEFKYNKNGVCINPVKITVESHSSLCAYGMYISFSKLKNNKWTFGYCVGTDQTEGWFNCAPCSTFRDQEYPTKSAAIQEAIDTVICITKRTIYCIDHKFTYKDAMRLIKKAKEYILSEKQLSLEFPI